MPFCRSFPPLDRYLCQQQTIDGVFVLVQTRAQNFSPDNIEKPESLAYQIHNFYCTVEELLKLVATYFENNITDNSQWHNFLLKPMMQPIGFTHVNIALTDRVKNINSMKPRKKISILILLTTIVIFLVLPFFRLEIAKLNHPFPNGILTLGGDQEREQYTFNFAKQHPELPIWISSGSRPEYICQLFSESGIHNALFLDYSAVDTVTNFTTLLSKFKATGVNHIYLVTSNFHMPRAKAIATIVLGSQSIAFTPISTSSSIKKESIFRILRDITRAYLWTLTRRTGATLTTWFRSSNTYYPLTAC